MRIPVGIDQSLFRFAAVLVLLVSGAKLAEAFYWPPWPGAKIPDIPGINPNRPPPGAGGNPPDRPPGPSGPHDPHDPWDPEPEDPPPAIPEPATLLMGIVGMGCVSAYRWFKRPRREEQLTSISTI